MIRKFDELVITVTEREVDDAIANHLLPYSPPERRNLHQPIKEAIVPHIREEKMYEIKDLIRGAESVVHEASVWASYRIAALNYELKFDEYYP